MAFLITGVGEDVIHAATHGIMSSCDLRFLRDRAEKVYNAPGRMVSKYFAAAKESLDNLDLGLLKERVLGMRDRFDVRFDPDRIRLIVDLSGFQNAKPAQRRVIMAHPRLRTLYHQGRAAGFGDLYEDEEPGVVGRKHSVYREIYNGSHDPTVEDETHMVTYFGVEDEDGGPMGVKDRHWTRGNHEIIDTILDHGTQDPSDPLRGTL